MDSIIIQHSVTLFEILCVIIVFATFFMSSRYFQEVFDHRITVKTSLLLMVFFGMLSIFGTLSGFSIYSAVVNVRDLGPMVAGLLCGPYVGIGAGIIGGLFRFAQGGPYMWTGLSAPILSGILGGIMYLANKRQFVPVWVAVVLIGLSETLISCYTLILVTEPEQFISVLTLVAIPMILFNIIGMFIFATIVHRTLQDRNRQNEMKVLELEVESKRNLSTIINTIAYPVYVLDREHRIVLINDSMCHFIGKSREEILGKTHRDFINTDDAERHWAWVEKNFQTHDLREEEVTITRPDGQVSTIISTSSVYMDSTGREFIVAVIHDITERQKMQSALKESEAWYRILFEHTGAATIIISENGTIEQANTEFTRLTGFAPNEIEGIMSLKHIACKEDIPMIKHYHHDRRIAPSSVPSSYTVRIVDRLGEMKILHAVVALIPGTKKSIASYVDISEQKRSEDAIKQMNRKLNLLSSITRHDIINQILILKGFLSLLKQSTGDASLLKYITKSEQAIHNIEHQIIFTRDYQDMGVKNPVWQNLRNTIITAKGAFNFEKISFETRVQDIEIFADPLFEKVFHNLIDNSIKYGGTDMKSIRISSHETDTGIEILYEDDGVGIETSEREKLFERGFGKHTGFGLFLSRDILSITGITIDEMGTQGTGVRFLIQVPKGGYRIAR